MVTVTPGIERIAPPSQERLAKKGVKMPKKDLAPKDLKIFELKARVRELENEKRHWEVKEKAFTKKLEKAKEFTSKATQVMHPNAKWIKIECYCLQYISSKNFFNIQQEKIIVAFLKRQGFTDAQVQVMSKGLKTAHIWGKEDIVEGIYQWKMGKQLYEYQQKKLWKMFPMPSLTAMKENTEKHQVSFTSLAMP